MRIEAPWTPEQVDALNAFQQHGGIHPFTCGRREHHEWDEGVLIAQRNGWRCPVEGCSYYQGWALGYMADRDVRDTYNNFWTVTRRKHKEGV